MQHLLLAHSPQSGMIFMAFHIKKFVHLTFKSFLYKSILV